MASKPMSTPAEPAAPAQPQSAQTAKQASGPAIAAKAANSGKRFSARPEGFGDTEVIQEWTPPDTQAFGAFVPAGGGRPSEVAREEAAEEPAAEEKPAEEAKPAPGEEKPEGDEKPAETGDEKPAEEKPGDKPAEKPEEKGEEPDPKATDKPSLMRRKALQALQREAENRSLVERATAAERRAQELSAQLEENSRARQEALDKLRQGPIEERLRAVGFESREQVGELLLRGEIPEFKAPAEPTPEAKRLHELEQRLAIRERDDQIQSVLLREGSRATVPQVIAEAARTWAAAGGKPNQHIEHINQAIATLINGERATGAAVQAIDAELANTEAYPAPFTRATAGAIEACRDVALTQWRASGAKPGDFGRFVKFAVDAAEEMYEERYKPLRSVFGVPDGAAPAKAAPKPAPKPSPPVGKRVPAKAPAPDDDDDGPTDPVLRNAWVKEQMRKSGRAGW